MAFKFSLATLLRVRQSIERQEELALQEILVKIAAVQRRIDTLANDLARTRQKLEEEMRQTLSAGEIDAITRQIEAALGRRQELVESLEELQRQREAQTRKFQAAHQRRRTLSDMHDSQLETYLQERARAEQKFVDDVFGARAQRN
jgi:flagellar FliJ protein